MAEDSENEAGLREIPASEILDKIQRGELVEYDHVRIMGDLDLSKLDLPTKHVTRTEFQIKTPELPEESKVVSSSIKITNSKFDAKVTFDNNLFRDSVNFENTIFSRDARFQGATFSGNSFFGEVTFSGRACFAGANFSRLAWFGLANFSSLSGFDEAIFHGGAWFDEAIFHGGALFDAATFSGLAWFSGATFSRDVWFNEAKFEGDVLTFKNATFVFAEDQEVACRRAKIVLARAGNRGEEEYHFYREMEAKRKLNGIFETSSNRMLETHQTLRAENISIIKRFLWYDIFEYVFIQKIFGYGVHPWQLMGWWIVIIISFAFIYWVRQGIVYWSGNGEYGVAGLFDYIKFSLATAIAPGYIATIISPGSTGYKLILEYQVLAIIETLIGTFMWAGFIATFAKRYMR